MEFKEMVGRAMEFRQAKLWSGDVKYLSYFFHDIEKTSNIKQVKQTINQLSQEADKILSGRLNIRQFEGFREYGRVFQMNNAEQKNNLSQKEVSLVDFLEVVNNLASKEYVTLFWSLLKQAIRLSEFKIYELDNFPEWNSIKENFVVKLPSGNELVGAALPIVDLKLRKVFIGRPMPGHDYWKALLYGIRNNKSVVDSVNNAEIFSSQFMEDQGFYFSQAALTNKWFVSSKLSMKPEVINIIGMNSDDRSIIGRTN